MNTTFRARIIPTAPDELSMSLVCRWGGLQLEVGLSETLTASGSEHAWRSSGITSRKTIWIFDYIAIQTINTYGNESKVEAHHFCLVRAWDIHWRIVAEPIQSRSGNTRNCKNT
jgi:hypothetical protein